jgi:anaerobic ribonucleoside-triphosphate reductase activating protein
MDATQIRIAGAVNDSIVDGPGIRMAIFAQGCTHDCPECHNPESHAFEGGTVKTIAQIVEAIARNPLLDGATFSGGEPFEQAAAFAELADAVHERGLNVWCYTGYLYEEVAAGTPSAAACDLLARIDVLVDGPYIAEQRSMDAKWRGSTNQRVIDMPATREAGHIVLLCS